MKLVFAIVSNEDDNKVVKNLNKEGFSVTKLSSTGGFLRVGNTTLLIGADEENLDRIIDIIKEHSKRRKRILINSEAYIGTFVPVTASQVNEIEVGGATIFVVDVDKFEKV